MASNEFVRVSFPRRRPLTIDGVPQGVTGEPVAVERGTHIIDLGRPLDYRPASRRLKVEGTSKDRPLEIAFSEIRTRRAPKPRRKPARKAASRKTAARGRTRRSARRAPARDAGATRESATSAPAARAARTDGTKVLAGLHFRTPTRTIPVPQGAIDAEALSRFQRAAMRWTYVLRNRKRWASLPASAKNQADRACEFLKQLGLTETDLQAIAADRLVEVVVPYTEENVGWEARIFPWEYVLSGATRAARRGEKLTVVRQLELPKAPPAGRTPVRVLFVQSAPGKLRDMYSFDTQRDLCKSNLRPKNWLALNTPTPAQLSETVAEFRPDIIHLAGFDSHAGLRLLRAPLNRRPETPNAVEEPRDRHEVPDGYLLAETDAGGSTPYDAVSLGRALCSGGHRPLLVSFNLHNSAARIAPMAIAAGAYAAIGVQDVFDDTLAELFFGSFYRAWRKSTWNLTRGFQSAWETVRDQPVPVTGSGLVLWSARPLVTTAPARAARPAPPKPRVKPHWLPGAVPADQAHEIIKPKIEPVTELNYSLLHNRCPLFTAFTLVNASADYKNDQLATLADVDVEVTLSAGTESASYKRRLALDTTSLDLKDTIHVPLTSELMRSVHESINSSLQVDVSWGKAIYRNSHLVRLLPVDQWRDNDQDGQWLPSFVLPRDPAVTGLVEKAQRYVRVLRDDPSAGFDGYQSLDPRAAEPAADVDCQVQALWSAIVHELQLGYINPPPTYSNAMDSQRLRTPSMTVREKSGTCIDLALLLAACCELIDVYPVIFLLKDHAFPGYWRQDVFQQQFMEVAEDFVDEVTAEAAQTTAAPGAQPVSWWFRESAYTEIVRQVKLGHLVPLESVWLTEHSGFWEAVDGGMENLKRSSRFHSMLDIARAREAGVTPLPLGGRS